MSARAGVTWSGLNELARELRAIPEAVKSEADGIVRQAANAHVAQMRNVFPERNVTGNLRRGNVLEARGHMKYVVRNRAPHSHLYEFGYDHVSGKRVEGHSVYIAAAEGLRDQMLAQLRELLTRVATRTGLLRAA